MPRMRGTPSPPYPIIGLPEVLERGRGLVSLVGGVVEQSRIFPALGFGSANGTSKSVLNTMRQYGFVAVEGGGLRVNPDVRVLYGDDSEARRQAMFAFARKPEIFRLLEERVPRALQEDQAHARKFLAELGYRPPAIETVLAAYRTTHDLLERQSSGRSPSEAGRPAPESVERHDGASARPTSRDGADAPVALSVLPPDVAGHVEERTLFSFGTEGRSQVRLVVDGDMPVRDVVAIVRLWAEITLREAGD